MINLRYLFFLDPITKNEPEECCNRPPSLKNPYCNEIPVPGDDYFYSKFNVKCIDFVRSFPSVRPGCRLGKDVCYKFELYGLNAKVYYIILVNNICV